MIKPILKNTIIAALTLSTIVGFVYYTNALNSYNDLVDKYSKLADEYDDLYNKTNFGK